MNNEDFRQHFINAANALGIEDITKRIMTVEPAEEKQRNANEYDDFMRLCVLPETRDMSFNGVISAFTQREGYYPLWIDISETDGEVHLKASMRMRKAGDNDDKEFYPFRVVLPEKTVSDLNDTGLVAYHVKCIAALIRHFGYDMEEWREALEYICDYTYLVNTFDKVPGRVVQSERFWGVDCRFKPTSVLRTGSCNMSCRDLQFKEYGADYGLCLKLQECARKKPAENRGEIYDRYLRADLRLLRALNNAMDHTSDISYDFFEEGRIVLLRDTLKILDELDIPYPDFEGLSENAFGEENYTKRFSSYELIDM